MVVFADDAFIFMIITLSSFFFLFFLLYFGSLFALLEKYFPFKRFSLLFLVKFSHIFTLTFLFLLSPDALVHLALGNFLFFSLISTVLLSLSTRLLIQRSEIRETCSYRLCYDLMCRYSECDVEAWREKSYKISDDATPTIARSLPITEVFSHLEKFSNCFELLLSRSLFKLHVYCADDERYGQRRCEIDYEGTLN